MKQKLLHSSEQNAIYTFLNDLSAFTVHALSMLPSLGAQKNGIGRDVQMHCKPFVQLSDHLNEDGFVSGILLQLFHAQACFICSLGEAGRSHCNVNDLAPGILSFCSGNLNRTPMLMKWLTTCLVHVNIDIININHRLSFCLQSKIGLIMVEILLCNLIYNILL